MPETPSLPLERLALRLGYVRLTILGLTVFASLAGLLLAFLGHSRWAFLLLIAALGIQGYIMSLMAARLDAEKGR